MTHDEIKLFIAEQTEAGHSLSQIQDMLAEKGAKMTFMELRLIASEIETGFWKKADPKDAPAKTQKDAPATPAAPAADGNFEDDAATGFEDDAAAGFDEGAEDYPQEETSAPAEPEEKAAGLRSKTTVTVSQIQRPGFLATGSVLFGSGASGDWCLDQLGRLMLEKVDGKPDKQDLQEFQLELQKAFGA